MATYMPANAAPAVVASLREILGKSAKTAYVTDILTNGSMEPLEIAGDELTTLQRADIAVLSKVVRPPKP